MTVPAVLSLAHQFPEMKITVAGPPVLREIFLRLPDNVNYVGINKRDYSGLRGLYRLYRELMDLHPTHVCDLHDVIRTKVLRFFFNLSHLPVTHIRKDRKAQKRFLNSRPPVQQETTFERYRKALERLGFPVDYSLFTPFTAPSRTGGIGK